MKQAILNDKHFYIWLALFVACTVFYYFGELVNLFGWEALRWDIFYTVHDPHRMLFLIPILYASYYYRLRGALLANVASLLIFLPRAFFISPYPDATLRMVAFVILAIVISMLTALTFNDRDKRNKLTEALKQAEEKNRIVLEQMYDSYYEVDLAGNFTIVNDSVCSNLGYSREELIGNNYRLSVPEDDIKRLLLAFNEVFRTGEPNKGLEHKIISKDGNIISVESSISLRKNEQGKIIGFRSVSRDVTERKQAEEKIKRTAAEWQATFDSITDLVSIQDRDSILVRVNKAYADTFQKKPEELAGRRCYEVVHETLCPIDNCPHQQALKTKTSITSEIFEPRLGVFLEISCSPIFDEQGEIAGTIHIAKNITERKQVEEALHNAEEKYRSLVENINDIFYMLDNKGNITYISPAVERLTLYKMVELTGKPVFPLVHPDDLPGLLESFNHLVGGQLVPWEFRLLDKDGRVIFMRTSRQLLYKDGKVIGITAMMTDITERKQAEQALMQSEEKYRALVENINDVFYSLDAQGNISYVSPVVERFTKYKVGDLIGKPFTPLIYPDDLPGLLDSFNRLVTGKLEPWEFRILDKDGRVIFVRTSSRPLYEQGEIVGFTALMTDITERKQMEQMLEEMATHDFLTGLPNRVLLLDRFNIAAALARRDKARLAVMSLDLDKFKIINDTLGHDAGDQVLKIISTRLTAIIRASDTLARVGGDEFMLLMLETKRMEDATTIAQKILDAFMEKLIVDGHELHLSTSIGISIYPEDAEDMDTLTKNSDAAMYYSKGHGRNRFKFFGDGDVRIGGDHKSAPDRG